MARQAAFQEISDRPLYKSWLLPAARDKRIGHLAWIADWNKEATWFVWRTRITQRASWLEKISISTVLVTSCLLFSSLFYVLSWFAIWLNKLLLHGCYNLGWPRVAHKLSLLLGVLFGMKQIGKNIGGYFVGNLIVEHISKATRCKLCRVICVLLSFILIVGIH